MKPNSPGQRATTPDTTREEPLPRYGAPELTQVGESADIQGYNVGYWYDNDTTYLYYD